MDSFDFADIWPIKNLSIGVMGNRIGIKGEMIYLTGWYIVLTFYFYTLFLKLFNIIKILQV